MLDGKMVDDNVALQLRQWADESNINLQKEFKEEPVTQAHQGWQYSRGGIEPPAGYDYDPGKGSLHDYCTKSPDQFPAPGENADFSGACAKHDMCYEATPDPSARVDCNTTLNQDMVSICKAVYTNSFDPRQGGCIATAKTYWIAVTAAHPSQWKDKIA